MAGKIEFEFIIKNSNLIFPPMDFLADFLEKFALKTLFYVYNVPINNK